MFANANNVIFTRNECECPLAHTSYAHHRNYPEIRTEGESPRVAAAQLVNCLARACHRALQNQPLMGASKPATTLGDFGHAC